MCSFVGVPCIILQYRHAYDALKLAVQPARFFTDGKAEAFECPSGGWLYMVYNNAPQ